MKKVFTLVFFQLGFFSASSSNSNYSSLKENKKKFLTSKILSVNEAIPIVKEVFGNQPEEGDWFLFDLHETIFVNVEFNERLVEQDFLKLFEDLKCKKGGLSFKDPTGLPEQIRWLFPKGTAERLALKLNSNVKKNIKKSGIKFDLLPGYSGKVVSFEDGMMMATKTNKKGSKVDKGEMLELFLEEVEKSLWPKKIFFMDDGKESVNLVRDCCEKVGIECICFYYPRIWTFKTMVKESAYFYPQIYIPFKFMKNMITRGLKNEFKSKNNS